MASRPILGAASAMISMVLITIGWYLTYSLRWIETANGDIISISEGYNQCQNNVIIATLASQDCSDLEGLWLAGNGCCGLGLIILVFSLLAMVISSSRTEAVADTNITRGGWGVRCPNCNAMNVLNSSNLPSSIDCGGCESRFAPSIVERLSVRRL